MTNRENFISLIKRTGYERMPVNYELCPSLQQKMDEYLKDHTLSAPVQYHNAPGLKVERTSSEVFWRDYYPDLERRPDTFIDEWGVAHEKGSPFAFHMTKMYHPMENFDSVEQVLSYPLPVFSDENLPEMKEYVKKIREQDGITMGNMQCTVWETAWYMRGMENLMCDMMMEDELAEVLLDRVTEKSVQRAEGYAKAGVDCLFLGDDIGMQKTVMMSVDLYRTWLMPRLKKVIDAAKKINPDLIVFYHSCGYVKEMIPSLIEAGIDVLNPVQPECMDFEEIHEKYGDRLSFHGTIGTQSVMPFGTPEEVRATVFRNLQIAGDHGGLLVAPTHLVEPEVPLENVLAYIKACEDFHR